MFYYLYRVFHVHDNRSYFGMHGTSNMSWGDDGYYPELRLGSKFTDAIAANTVNPQHLKVETLLVSTSRDVITNRLEQILTPATYADPRCMNVTPQEFSKIMHDATIGKQKSNDHKTAMSIGKQGNTNSLGKVNSDATNAAISSTRIAKKLKWIHNLTTREELQLEAGEDMLEGFQLGRLPIKLRKKGPVPANGQWRDVSY